jgi:hypothetical protein
MKTRKTELSEAARLRREKAYSEAVKKVGGTSAVETFGRLADEVSRHFRELARGRDIIAKGTKDHPLINVFDHMLLAAMLHKNALIVMDGGKPWLNKLFQHGLKANIKKGINRYLPEPEPASKWVKDAHLFHKPAKVVDDSRLSAKRKANPRKGNNASKHASAS